MFNNWFSTKQYDDIAPDEIFLDSQNNLDFNKHHLEGRLATPIKKQAIFYFALVVAAIFLLISARVFHLQVLQGEVLYAESRDNTLSHEELFARRGAIVDRTGTKLAWSEYDGALLNDFGIRRYISEDGFAHVLGYISYPQKDNNGNYFRTRVAGESGVEAGFDNLLAGKNGLEIREKNALGKVVSQSEVTPATPGETLELTIDARVQQKMHELIRSTAQDRGFTGGAGVLMDLSTGDVIAMTSYPEYETEQLVNPSESFDLAKLREREDTPFLNRVSAGMFTPGSIIKPFMATAALNEGVITPQREILSTGQLVVPNPYNTSQPTIFKDWKAHGSVDMREALAVSSNVYFYQIGGGYEDQEGLGVQRIYDYAHAFGFGEKLDITGVAVEAGLVPNRAWKNRVFDDEWRIGDTYNTAIGQYGFQVTPLQVVRSIGSIALEGTLVSPRLSEAEPISESRVQKDVPPAVYRVVQEGMRQAVADGTAGGLDVGYMKVAAKTGTAELGAEKTRVNSWVVGYYPADKPRYAFTVVMESGPRSNVIGGVFVMRRLFDWMYREELPYIPGVTPESLLLGR